MPRLCVGERPSEVPGPSRKGVASGPQQTLEPSLPTRYDVAATSPEVGAKGQRGGAAPAGTAGGGGSWKALGRERGGTQETPRVCACRCEPLECAVCGFAGFLVTPPWSGPVSFHILRWGCTCPLSSGSLTAMNICAPGGRGPLGHRVPGCQIQNLSCRVAGYQTRPQARRMDPRECGLPFSPPAWTFITGATSAFLPPLLSAERSRLGTQVHVCMHAGVYVHAGACVHSSVCACACTGTYACVHMCVHVQVHMCTQARVCACVRVQVCVYAGVCVKVQVHVHMCVHAQVCVCTQVRVCACARKCTVRMCTQL